MLYVTVAPIQTFCDRIPVQDFSGFVFCWVKLWIIFPEGVDYLIDLFRMRCLYLFQRRLTFGNRSFLWSFWYSFFPGAALIYCI